MKKIISILLLFTFSLYSADATIEVIKKVDRLPTISVEDASTSYGEIKKKLFFKTLISDLNVLSLYNVERTYTQITFDSESVSLNNRKQDYVLRYQLRKDDNGLFNTDIKLFYNKSLVYQKSYRIKNDNYYIFLVHSIAFDINKYMGNSDVDWIKKKIVLSRLVGANKSEILITDYTLSYSKVILKGGMNIFPKWANTKQSVIYYTSLDGKRPTLFKLNTRTGNREKLLSSDGMLICSDVSSDGKKLLLTMAPSGQPDIYVYDVVTKKYSRLTKYSGIDVNAQFMSNNRVVFISNRLGYPNVFSKKIGSNAVEQMVYYGKSNSACSAYKDYVVYKSRESNNAFSRNTFNLHLISTKTDFIRRLTATGENEFPRFSEDGGTILFIKNYKSQSSIGVIRLETNKNFLFPLKIGKIQSIDW
jgi:TolB protein